jgi:RNA polymerase sigma factor (TIGR02999 family)
MPIPDAEVTTLLGLANQGDEAAKEALYRLVESELRKLARGRLRHERAPHLMQTTVLVDEAFIKLVGSRNSTWLNRSQFYGVAAKVMRQLLVDEARQRAASKRGGAPPTSLDAVPDLVDRTAADPLTVLAVHEALTGLAASRPDLTEVVELHHFGGWDLHQVADILHVSYGTIKRRWQLAKALLHRALSGGDDDVGQPAS